MAGTGKPTAAHWRLFPKSRVNLSGLTSLPSEQYTPEGRVAIDQDDRGFDLALRYRPVLAQQPVLSGCRHEVKAVLFVESHRPARCSPGSGQQRMLRLSAKLREQLAADTLVAVFGSHVGVPDQRGLPLLLQPHYADQTPAQLVTPESDARGHLVPQFLTRHIRFLPALAGNRSPVCTCRVIDDVVDIEQIVVITCTYH